MIPKKIHYCWFGRGEMPKLMKKCLKSWKKYCPDWKIVRWDEDSFDIHSTAWTEQAYEAKKYAFVADFVRLKALYELGGVYLDADQELIKPLEPFLHHKAFLGFMGKESVSAGVIGAEPAHPVIGEMRDYFQDRPYCQNSRQDTTPNTDWITRLLVEKGLRINDEYQTVAEVAVYPQTYFCPTSCLSVENCITEDTVSLHHWAMSWRSEKGRRDMKRMKRHSTKWYKALVWLRCLPGRTLRKLLGDETVEKLKGKR